MFVVEVDGYPFGVNFNSSIKIKPAKKSTELQKPKNRTTWHPASFKIIVVFRDRRSTSTPEYSYSVI